MEIELAVMAPSFKTTLSSQCRKYKETLETFKRSLKFEESRVNELKNKETLMGPSFNSRPGFGNQREKLLHVDNAMFAGVSKLEEAKRAGYSAEGYAVQSMNELKGQREKLEHAIQNNREISDNLSQGTRILNNMIRRNIQNKLIMFGIAFLLICAIVFLIYMKLS
jgi:vesicle transport through interaction with t-SNAREs protein 1